MKVLFGNTEREQALLAIAYGLFLTCTSATLWGGYLQYLDIPARSEIFTWEYLVRSASFPASLLTASFIAYRFPKARNWHSPAVALALSLTGIVATTLDTASTLESHWPLAIVGGCFGWASGIMFCALQNAVASQKVLDAGIIVFSAAGISAVLFFAIELIPNDIASLTVVPGLVFSSLLFTWSTRRSTTMTHPMFETIPRQRIDRCRAAFTELWRPLLCVAFSAFAIGIVRIEATTGNGSTGQTNASNMTGLLIASIALLITWKTMYKRATLMRLYQILFPLTATAFLALPLFEGAFREIVISFIFAVFSITSSLMVVSCARTARSQALPPVLVYGLFAGIVYASEFIGSSIGLVVSAKSGFAIAKLSVVALIAIYLLSMAMIAPQKSNRRHEDTGKPLVAEAKDTVGAESGAAPASAPTPAAPHSTSTANSQLAGDIISSQCARAIERYGLSRREADVLNLLARGRDVPYIAEDLVISKNTVRSHTKSIFTKTGVHSRQELIDLVESIEA